MQIEIDFEVFKALTALRQDEVDSYNEVLRRLLKLPNAHKSAPETAKPVQAGMFGRTPNARLPSTLLKGPSPKNALAAYMDGAWFNGVFFPNGTILKATYKGQNYAAEIKGGLWVDSNGCVRTSPSEAASAISGTNVNGWRFWHAKGPGDEHWRRLDDFQ